MPASRAFVLASRTRSSNSDIGGGWIELEDDNVSLGDDDKLGTSLEPESLPDGFGIPTWPLDDMPVVAFNGILVLQSSYQ